MLKKENIMPFRSKSQVRACFAKKDPNWDCHQWADETSDIKSLPEKKKKKKKFSEWLNEEVNRTELQNTLLRDLVKEILDYVNTVIDESRTGKSSMSQMAKAQMAHNIKIRIDSKMVTIDP